MEYQLYTVPRCDDCEAVKSFLDARGIQYTTLNLLLPEHKKIFGEIYFGIDGKLKKTVQNKTVLPLLVEKNESGGVERFAQRSDDIKALFN